MQDDGAAILMHWGHDFGAVVRHAPRKHVRLDQYGWLVLSGEPDCADLNMAAVVRGARRSLLDEYLREILSRGLSAILVVDPGDESLLNAATDAGLTQVATVPVMLRRTAPITPIPRAFAVRRATSGDVAVANDLAAEAFSLNPSVVQRAFPPSYLSDTIETWLVEDAGDVVGCGTFIRSGDSVGVYTMATPARNQGRGIGRAVLEHGMQHYQRNGVSAFTLEATDAGLHLYEQLGFRTVMEASVFVIGVSTQFPSQ